MMKRFLAITLAVLLIPSVCGAWVFGAPWQTSGSGLLAWIPLHTNLSDESPNGWTPTQSRASTAIIQDWEGHSVTALSGGSRFLGDRYVRNELSYSEDFSQGGTWAYGGAGKGGDATAELLSAVSGVVYVYQTPTLSQLQSRSRIFSVELKSVSGNVNAGIRLGSRSGTYSFTDSAWISISDSGWTRISVARTSAATADEWQVVIQTQAASQIYARKALLEDATGRTDTTNPSEYVATGASAAEQWFSTTNGNTVASNVVTEATGDRLHPLCAKTVTGLGTFDELCKFDPWAPTTAYALGDRVIALTNSNPVEGVAGNGYWYTVTSAGISDGAEPSWDTTIGNPVTDGSVTLENSGYYRMDGYYPEQSSTSKNTNYNIVPADTYGSVLTSGNLTVGMKYEIVAYDGTTCDFTADGAANNNVGTQFVATSATQTLTATNTAKRVQWGTGEVSTAAINNHTGITISDGDAASTCTIVADSAAATTFGINGLLNSNKVLYLDNTGGATDAYATASGTYGNTNAHSNSAVVRAGAGTCYVEDSGGVGNASTASAAYSRLKQENFTPADAGNQIRIHAPAGAGCYFALLQAEEKAFATSYIVTAGSATTRAADALSYPPGMISNVSGTVLGTFRIFSTSPTNGKLVSNGTGGDFIYEADTLYSSTDGTNVGSTGALTLTDSNRVATYWGAGAKRMSGGGASGASGDYDGAWGGGAVTIMSGVNGTAHDLIFGKRDILQAGGEAHTGNDP